MQEEKKKGKEKRFPFTYRSMPKSSCFQQRRWSLRRGPRGPQPGLGGEGMAGGGWLLPGRRLPALPGWGVCSGHPLPGGELQEHSEGRGQPSASSSLAAPVTEGGKPHSPPLTSSVLAWSICSPPHHVFWRAAQAQESVSDELLAGAQTAGLDGRNHKMGQMPAAEDGRRKTTL